MLTFDIETGILQDPQGQMVFADRPYQYSITGKKDGSIPITDPELTRRKVNAGPGGGLDHRSIPEPGNRAQAGSPSP